MFLFPISAAPAEVGRWALSSSLYFQLHLWTVLKMLTDDARLRRSQKYPQMMLRTTSSRGGGHNTYEPGHSSNVFEPLMHVPGVLPPPGFSPQTENATPLHRPYLPPPLRTFLLALALLQRPAPSVLGCLPSRNTCRRSRPNPPPIQMAAASPPGKLPQIRPSRATDESNTVARSARKPADRSRRSRGVAEVETPRSWAAEEEEEPKNEESPPPQEAPTPSVSAVPRVVAGDERRLRGKRQRWREEQRRLPCPPAPRAAGDKGVMGVDHDPLLARQELYSIVDFGFLDQNSMIF